jgi:hypothetical protein
MSENLDLVRSSKPVAGGFMGAAAGCKSGCNLSETRGYPGTQEWL